MNRYLVFAPLGASAFKPMILGAVKVPPCFEPNDAMIDTAERCMLDLFIMTGPDDAVPDHLLGMGDQFMTRLAQLHKAPLN